MEWKSILNGWYSISEFGTIRTEGRESGRVPGRILKQQQRPDGYLAVSLSVAGKPNRYRVHRLVAEAWYGPGQTGQLVNHKDGNKTNNHYSNLEWCWPDENTQHAVRTGLRARGSKLAFSKLDENQVAEIRTRYHNDKATFKELLVEYDIEKSTLSSLLSGKTWKHVGGPISRRRRGDTARKITEDQVREIRSMATNGRTYKELAEKFNIGIANISSIVRRRTWKHI